ncbi:MAG TPA: ABC transporter permease [Deltaproteobacteria bacterium]|nr:ABC transporter permease [Deltaproteobacteria bacterium]
MIIQDDKEQSQRFMRLERPSDDTVLMRLCGTWKIGQNLPSALDMYDRIAIHTRIKTIIFDSTDLGSWDSTLLTFLIRIIELCGEKGITVERGGLPTGVQKLLSLAMEALEKKALHKEETPGPFLARIGEITLNITQSAAGMFAFIGEATTAFIRLIMGRARFRSSDMVLTIQECGPQALPIVSLISALVGVIVAFVGIIQLRLFGAEIYIANVVGIAMAREMGALMTAIIMMGRTGAAFAAQLGTMEVNEEIDALKTLGISPMEFLVMPRIIALVLMMPLLCLYSDIVGILGGAVIGIGMFDLSITQYYDQTLHALNLTHFSIGIIKSAVFAVLIALSGCYYGIHCGRSASSVGDATTSAVVTGIVLIVVADGIFAIITNALWI